MKSWYRRNQALIVLSFIILSLVLQQAAEVIHRLNDEPIRPDLVRQLNSESPRGVLDALYSISMLVTIFVGLDFIAEFLTAKKDTPNSSSGQMHRK